MFSNLFKKCFYLRSEFYLRTTKTIGTHNGKFHTDEALACFFLKKLPTYSDAKIIRSRDMEILEKTDIIVDVGGVYDHEKKRYDHHQKSFFETMSSLKVLPSYNTKLSSAGLIYSHYGKEVISQILNIPINDPNIDIIYDRMYYNFVEAIDANDNGISCYKGPPKYNIPESIDTRVNDLMPYWNSGEADDEDALYRQFLKAIELVGESFTGKLKYFYYAWLPARNFVKDAIEKRFSVHPSGKLIHFDNGGLPWKAHIFDLEIELGLEESDICFVIYKDNINNRYRIQAIPARESANTFRNRASLKEEWRGLDKESLIKVSGIDDIDFVHASGFIGAASSFDSVVKMGLESLN
uniref:UPF0160 protein MYG1, mitochondrial n=1 Tax=Strongyloides papillosus TaxID=174720 RepID=A0A0N5B6J6_STREA